MSKGLVGIIGGAGAMGSYFGELFQKADYAVMITDTNELEGDIKAHEKDFQFVLPQELAEGKKPVFDIMMFSVLPITETYNVIEKYARLVKPGGLLTDVTSVKVKPVDCMVKNAPERVEVIGMHPMFRPDLSIEGQRVILTPANHSENSVWQPKLEEIIKNNGGLVTVAPAKTHDYMMAFIQDLVHHTSMTALKTIMDSEVKLEELAKYSSPVYRTFFDLMSRIVSGKAELYRDIQTENPFWTGKILEKFCEVNHDQKRRVLTSMSDGDKREFKVFYNNLKKFVKEYNEGAELRLSGIAGKTRDVQLFFEGKYSENITELLRLPKLKVSNYETLTMKQRTIDIATASIEAGHLSKLQRQQNYLLAQYTKRLDLGKRPSHVVFYIRNVNHPNDDTKFIRFSPITSDTTDKDETVKKSFVREQLKNTYQDPISNIFHTHALLERFAPTPLIVFKSGSGK